VTDGLTDRQTDAARRQSPCYAERRVDKKGEKAEIENENK